MAGRSALRGGDHVSVAVAVVDHRRSQGTPASCPARGQKQQLVAEGTDALAAPGMELVDGVLVPVGHVQQTMPTLGAIPGSRIARTKKLQSQTTQGRIERWKGRRRSTPPRALTTISSTSAKVYFRQGSVGASLMRSGRRSPRHSMDSRWNVSRA